MFKVANRKIFHLFATNPMVDDAVLLKRNRLEAARDEQLEVGGYISHVSQLDAEQIV